MAISPTQVCSKSPHVANFSWMECNHLQLVNTLHRLAWPLLMSACVASLSMVWFSLAMGSHFLPPTQVMQVHFSFLDSVMTSAWKPTLQGFTVVLTRSDSFNFAFMHLPVHFKTSRAPWWCLSVRSCYHLGYSITLFLGVCSLMLEVISS